MLFWPALADADITAASKAQRLAGEVRMLMGSDLPPVAVIIPGYQPDETVSQSLIVARFTDEVDDGMAWGESLSLILRHRIMYVPGVRLVMPGEEHGVRYEDARMPGIGDKDVYRSIESLRTAGSRLGIRYALRGHVTKQDNRFTIEVALLDLHGGGGEQRETFESTGGELAAALGDIALWVYDLLGVALTADESAYLQTPRPSNPEHLVLFAQAVTLMPGQGPEAKVMLGKLNKQATDFPAAALLWLGTPADSGASVFPENEARKVVAEFYRHDNGVQLQLIRGLFHDNRPDLLEEKADRLKTLLAAEPNQPIAMLFLADLLKDRDRTAQALALSMEALRRWPDNYRVWWAFSHTLLEQAWFYRGHRFIEETPSEDAARYNALRRYAAMAVDMALSYHDAVSNLWVLKIRTLGQYSPEIMQALNRGVALDPRNPDLYSAAMNYTAPAWGGDVDEQLRIYDLAVANNPGEEWPLDMANHFIPGYKWEIVLASMLNRQGCNSDCRDWVWLVALAVALLVSALWWWRKYLTIFELILRVLQPGRHYKGPRKTRVDDTVLGPLRYSNEEQLWETLISPDKSPVLLKIAGVAEPSTDLVAKAREIVMNYRDFKRKVVAFLFESSKTHERSAGEIRSLLVSGICLLDLERPNEATVYFKGMDQLRIWSCEYSNGRLHNLALADD